MLSENNSALLSLPNEIISHIISDVIISNEIEIFDPFKETRLVCKAIDDHYKAVRNTQKFRHLNYIRSSGFFDPETTVWTADFSTIWANIQNSHDTSFSRAASNATFQQCARILQLDMSIGPSSFGHKLQTHRLCLEFWARVIRNVGNLSRIDFLSDGKLTTSCKMHIWRTIRYVLGLCIPAKFCSLCDDRTPRLRWRNVNKVRGKWRGIKQWTLREEMSYEQWRIRKECLKDMRRMKKKVEDYLNKALGRCNADGSGLREVAGNIKETTEDLAEEPENPHCYSEEEDESDVEDVILEV
ncbi:uncharacterized protein RAG0_09570 [Rhynchosporium agropyri]|uniref:Uncharacterized protein n=1 Tax=Rhynchosporium agropyri TaxID=914238 RepID=A0A1E1KYY4_9HELO|nr:uncharacterized protein RAG0_09570 [Rhynchosporium agropyri]